MDKREYMDTILAELQTELTRQSDFLERMKRFNKDLEINGFQPLYSVKQVIAAVEQNINSIRAAARGLPLEDEEE